MRSLFFIAFLLISIQTGAQEIIENNIDKERGYINITEVIYSIRLEDTFNDGSYEDKSKVYGIRTINGYQFNSVLTLGVGVGIQKLYSNTYIPLSIDVRVSLLRGKIRPTLNANLGYAFETSDLSYKYFFINPSVGVKIKLSRKLAYLFNVGYNWDRYPNENISYYSFNNNGSSYYSEPESPKKVTVMPYLVFTTGVVF